MPVHLVVRPEDASRFAREWAARAAAFPPWAAELAWRWTSVPQWLEIVPGPALGSSWVCREMHLTGLCANIQKVLFVSLPPQTSHTLERLRTCFPHPRGSSEW